MTSPIPFFKFHVVIKKQSRVCGSKWHERVIIPVCYKNWFYLKILPIRNRWETIEQSASSLDCNLVSDFKTLMLLMLLMLPLT